MPLRELLQRPIVKDLEGKYVLVNQAAARFVLEDAVAVSETARRTIERGQRLRGPAGPHQRQ